MVHSINNRHWLCEDKVFKSECQLTVNENRTWMGASSCFEYPIYPKFIPSILFLIRPPPLRSVPRNLARCSSAQKFLVFPKVLPCVRDDADKIVFLQFFPFPFATSRQSCGCPRDVLHMHTGPEGVAVPFCRQGGGTGGGICHVSCVGK